MGDEFSDSGAFGIHILNSNNSLASALQMLTVQMLAANFSFYGETKFFSFSVYPMVAKAQYILFVAFIFTCVIM